MFGGFYVPFMTIKFSLNLKLSTHVPYDDLSNFNAKLKIFPHFHGPLNIENDSADRASVY